MVGEKKSQTPVIQYFLVIQRACTHTHTRITRLREKYGIKYYIQSGNRYKCVVPCIIPDTSKFKPFETIYHTLRNKPKCFPSTLANESLPEALQKMPLKEREPKNTILLVILSLAM